MPAAGQLGRVDAGRQLLDATSSPEVEREIRALLESIDDVRVTDLHAWEIGHGARGCVVSLTTSTPREPRHYRETLLAGGAFAHVTVQVERCSEGHPRQPAPAAAPTPGAP